MTPPPPLSDLTSSDAWKDLSDEDKTKVIGGWQQHATEYGKATVPGWNEDHAITIHNAVKQWTSDQAVQKSVNDPAFMAGGAPIGGGDLQQFITPANPNALSPFVGESAAIDNPTINSLDEFGAAYGQSLVKDILPRPAGEAFAGVRRAEDVVESLASPFNLVLAGILPGAAPLVQKAIGAYFAGSMGKEALEKVPEVADALRKGDYTKAGEDLTEAGISGLFATGAAAHTFGRPKTGGISPEEVKGGLREGGLSPEAITRITNDLERGKLAPATPYERAPGTNVSDEVVDGWTVARQKLLTGFQKTSPEVQKQRQALIDTLDEQLLQVPREQVNASVERTKSQAPSTPPKAAEATAIQSARPSVENKGTSALFKAAKAEADAVSETPSKPLSVAPGGEVRPETTTEAPVAPAEGEAPPAKTRPVTLSPSDQSLGYELHEIDADKLDAAWKEDPLYIGTGGKGETHGRKEALHQFLTDNPAADMEAPRVSVDENGKVSVEDGRHRTAAMLNANREKIPVALSPESAEDARKVGLIEPAAPDVTTERQSPLDQLRALEADVQAAPADAKAEKMVSVLQKIGRVNRDSTKAVASELRYYSDEELGKLQQHLGTEDAELGKIAKAITGRDVIKETDRPGGYKNEPSGAEGRADAPEVEAQKDAFGEDYTGGPGAMGPREAAAMEAAQTKTGIRNALIDPAREKLGLPPRVAPIAKAFGPLWNQAMRLFDANDNVGRDLVSSLKLKVRPLTDLEDAVLTHEQLMRHEAFDEAVESVNKAETPEEAAQAQAALENARQDVFDIYDVGSRAGTENARGLSARRLMVKEDYSLAKMEARKRANQGGKELTKEQLDEVKSSHEKMTELEKRVAETESALSEASGHEEMARIYEAEIREIQKQAAKQPKISKPILDIARDIVDRLNTRADAARTRLSERLSRMSAGVDPGIVLDVAEIMAAHIGEIGLKSAEVSARVLEEFGEKVKPFLKDAWKKAKQLIDAEKAPVTAKEFIRKTGVGKKEPTTGDVKAKLKADAKAGDELSQNYVADLVRTHLKAGLHGDEAIAATRKDVLDSYPSATERDVRRAYVEYGKKRWPSKDAINVEMAELRQIVKIQEDINREMERLQGVIDPETGELIGAEKQGFMRPKNTQKVRDLIKQRNELMKNRPGPQDEGKLASRNEVRKTALINAIADTNRELQTGIKKAKSEPFQHNAENEQLASELQAMREKLREIEEDAKPKQSEADKQIEQLGKQKQRLDDILSGKLDKTAPKPFEALSEEAENLKAEIQAMHELAAQMRRDALPKKDPNYTKEQAQIKRFEEAAKRYEEKLKAGDFSTKDKGAPRPDTVKVAVARDVMEARRAAYEAAKKSDIKFQTERYNDTQATRIKKQLDILKDKNARGDFTRPPKRVPPKLSAANEIAKSELQRERDTFEEGMARDRQKNRTKSQKFWDAFVGIERLLKLSSDVVLTKLSTAAFLREFALTPVEEVVGAGISKVIPKLATKAHREGGISLEAEMKAKAEFFTKGMADAYRNLKMQKSDLETLYGKKGQPPPAWYEYLGFLHAALKAPVKRAEFARSLSKRMIAAAKDGVDVNDPAVMRRLSQESYVDANRSIFMQDNVVSNAFTVVTKIMENSKIAPNLGPAMARIARFLIPVVRVPTNIVGEVSTGVHGGATGAGRAIYAYAKGIDSLPPQQADAIMRQLKKGAIGNSLLLLGYFGYKSIGGFHQEGDKRSSNDVGPERYRLGGVDLPPAFGHSTAAMLLNIGATLHRVEEEKGFAAGARQGAFGAAKGLPFIPAATNIVNALETERGFQYWIHNLITSSATPALTQHIAKVIDTPGSLPENAFTPARRRVPANPLDALKMGVPGLRQQVPQKQSR